MPDGDAKERQRAECNPDVKVRLNRLLRRVKTRALTRIIGLLMLQADGCINDLK